MNSIQLSMFDGKVCKKCKEEKPRELFSRSSRFSDGLRRWCKVCDLTAKREHYKKNAVAVHKQQNIYRQKNIDRYRKSSNRSYHRHKDQITQRQKDDRKANPEKYRKVDRKRYAKNPEKFQSYQKTYRKANPLKCNVWARARRARKKVGGTFTTQQWEALYQWFGSCCLCCGKCDITIDHVVPISLGGTNTIENLQPLCNSCNNHKHATTIDYRDPDQLAAFLEHIQC